MNGKPNQSQISFSRLSFSIQNQFHCDFGETGAKLGPRESIPVSFISLWQAGFALAEYVLHHRDVSRLVSTSTQKFSTQKILELGAGVGTTGIILAKQGLSTTLSDFTDEVITNLKSGPSFYH